MQDKYMIVRNASDIERYLASVREAATAMYRWIGTHDGDSLDLVRKLKFDTTGFHPIHGHALNIVEQINQTWSYAAALAAARKLLQLHPEALGYRLAPGAHKALDLDIMSEAPGIVGAEVFAAVDPHNNQKLQKDLSKLASRLELHRYVFFMSPRFPGTRRVTELEQGGIQVWSVEV